MPGPEEWPSRRSDPADRIRLTGPAATIYLDFNCLRLAGHEGVRSTPRAPEPFSKRLGENQSTFRPSARSLTELVEFVSSADEIRIVNDLAKNEGFS
jgi:hypothetical protein